MFQQSSSIACHLTLCLLDLASSLERYAILFGADCLSCFHSSASASQYFISEYSISFLASAACSRHMASNAANCFLEYMHFPVVTQSTHLLIEANLRCCNPTRFREYVSECLAWSCLGRARIYRLCISPNRNVEPDHEPTEIEAVEKH